MTTRNIPDAAYRQLAGYIVNERQSANKTREWIETWLDTWCPMAPIDKLIERSSLGTPTAKAIRASAPKEAVGRTLRRAEELSRQSKVTRFQCTCGSECHKVCTSPWCCDCGQPMSMMVDSRKRKKKARK